jgi:hypothetical protein
LVRLSDGEKENQCCPIAKDINRYQIEKLIDINNKNIPTENEFKTKKKDNPSRETNYEAHITVLRTGKFAKSPVLRTYIYLSNYRCKNKKNRTFTKNQFLIF